MQIEKQKQQNAQKKTSVMKDQRKSQITFNTREDSPQEHDKSGSFYQERKKALKNHQASFKVAKPDPLKDPKSKPVIKPMRLKTMGNLDESGKK
mmetsp:Transcript_30627/g.47005  ORF Transcript_30627/g.47005 Transcript_30627/m.47005 type:complete len:94 (+) Transcript_30627:2774-3055(+)